MFKNYSNFHEITTQKLTLPILLIYPLTTNYYILYKLHTQIHTLVLYKFSYSTIYVLLLPEFQKEKRCADTICQYIWLVSRVTVSMLNWL